MDSGRDVSIGRRLRRKTTSSLLLTPVGMRSRLLLLNDDDDDDDDFAAPGIDSGRNKRTSVTEEQIQIDDDQPNEVFFSVIVKPTVFV